MTEEQATYSVGIISRLKNLRMELRSLQLKSMERAERSKGVSAIMLNNGLAAGYKDSAARLLELTEELELEGEK